MPTRQSYSKSVSFGALTFVSLTLLGIGSSIAVARLYGIVTVGEVALVLAPGAAMALLAAVKVQAALVRELSLLEPRAPRITGLFWAAYAFGAGSSMLAGLIVGVGTWIVFTGPIDRPDLLPLAFVNIASVIVVNRACNTLDIVFSSFRAGRQLFWIRLWTALSYVGIAVAGAIILDNAWGLLLAQIGSNVTSLVHRMAYAGRLMRARISARELRDGFRALPDLIRFGLKVAPGRLADGVADQAGVWILGTVAPIAAVGAWSRAWTLGSRLYGAAEYANEMLLPTLVERHHKGHAKGFDRSLIDSARYAAVGMLLAASAGGGAAVGVMQLFGAGFERGAGALAALLVLPALASVATILDTALLAMNRPGQTTLVSLARLAITVTASVGLTLWIGITGTALALVLGYFGILGWLAVLAQQHLSAPIRSLWPIREGLALLVAYGTGFAAARAVDVLIDGPAGVLVALAAGGAAFVIAFVAASGVNDRDRERLRWLMGAIRARRMRGPDPAVDPS